MKHISVFLWQGLHPSIKVRLTTAPQKFFPGLQDPQNHAGAITIIPRAQSLKDADKRDALKRGGV
jgi:hypothetical protein